MFKRIEQLNPLKLYIMYSKKQDYKSINFTFISKTITAFVFALTLGLMSFSIAPKKLKKNVRAAVPFLARRRRAIIMFIFIQLLTK